MAASGTMRHINGDAVPFFYAELFQAIGEFAHFVTKLVVGDRPDFGCLPMGDRLAFSKRIAVLSPRPAVDVAVEAVVGHVCLGRRRTIWRTEYSIPAPSTISLNQ